MKTREQDLKESLRVSFRNLWYAKRRQTHPFKLVDDFLRTKYHPRLTREEWDAWTRLNITNVVPRGRNLHLVTKDWAEMWSRFCLLRDGIPDHELTVMSITKNQGRHIDSACSYLLTLGECYHNGMYTARDFCLETYMGNRPGPTKRRRRATTC